MKTHLVPIAVAILICSSELVSACGGVGSGARIARGSFGGGVPIVSAAPAANPMFAAIAMQNAQFAMARQAAIAQANAYNARMRPVRLANASRVRQQRLAMREARKEIRIAKLEAQRHEEQEFLAKARTWTDVTGNHQVIAVLADANAWGVKLQKKDGSTVNVPMERLSSPDQTVVAAVIARGIDNGVMLAGL